MKPSPDLLASLDSTLRRHPLAAVAVLALLVALNLVDVLRQASSSDVERAVVAIGAKVDAYVAQTDALRERTRDVEAEQRDMAARLAALERREPERLRQGAASADPL